MNHFEFEINLFVENELPENKIEELNIHLANCEHCRQVLSDYIEIKDGIKQFYEKLPERVVLPAQSSLENMIKSRIKNNKEFNTREIKTKNNIIRKFLLPKVFIPLSAAVVIIIAVIVFKYIGSENIQHIITNNDTAINKEIKPPDTEKTNKRDNKFVLKKHVKLQNRITYKSRDNIIKDQQADITGIATIITPESFNEVINKDLSEKNDSSIHIRDLLSLSKSYEMQDFNSTIDSTLEIINIGISN